MYDFKNLSYLDFEALVADLLAKETGLHFELFKPGKDGGIDARAFSANGDAIIVQCKHYANSEFADLLYKVKNEEIAKIHKIKPKTYYLFTSLPLNPDNKQKLFDLLKDYAPTPDHIYGMDDINTLLRKHEDVVKKHFKLWLTSTAILTKILHSGIHNITEIEIRAIQEKMKLYVHNESYGTANKILAEKHYAIISGMPGIGKSTLAETLLYEHLESGYEAVKVTENISDALKLLTPDTPQFFYYDDFLGTTSLSDKLGKNEDQNLLTFIKAVKNSTNKRLVLTTREYILQQAKYSYERLSDPSIDMAKCIIDLANYTKLVRAKILYNHVYFAEIPSSYKEQLLREKAFLKIIDHKNFNPRIIEWMVNLHNLQDIKEQDYAQFFLANLENPERLWSHAFENQISEASRYLLVTLYSLDSQASLAKLESTFVNSTHYKHADFKTSLKQLEGSFLHTNKEVPYFADSSLKVGFQNPSVRDFLKNHMSQTYDYLEHLLEKASYFSQLVSMWGNPLYDYNPPPTRKSLLNKSDKFIETLKRLYLSPYKDELKHRIIDSPYEMRAALLFRALEATKSAEVKQCLLKTMDSLTSACVSDTNALYSLLLQLEISKDIFSSEEKEAFVSSVKGVILETPGGTSDCVTITELCDSFSDSLSEDEYEETKDMVQSYDHAFDDAQIKEASSVEELEEEIQKITKVETFWGVSFLNLNKAIKSRIKAIEEEKEEMEKHVDPNDWEDTYAASLASNAQMDAHISQMFDTLKN